MSETPKVPTTSATFQAAFGNMSDSQLRQTISQLSSAANRTDQFQAFVSPTPLPAHSRSMLLFALYWMPSCSHFVY